MNAEFNASGRPPRRLSQVAPGNRGAFSLAPDLARRRMELPRTLAAADPQNYEMSLLEAFGVPTESASLIVKIVLERPTYVRGSEMGVFFGRPKHGGIRMEYSDSLLAIGMQYYVDWERLPYWPSHGLITCDCVVRVGASLAEAVRDFRKFYAALTTAARLPASSKAYRNPKFFTRDLTVYAFREARSWCAEDLDLQLDHMGLPLLGEATRKPGKGHQGKGYTEAKDARRKIVFGVGRLISACKSLPPALRGRI